MDNRNKCSVMVSGNDRVSMFHPRNCENKAGVQQDSKGDCKIHDPEYVKQKDGKRTEKWNREFNLRVAGSIAQDACRQINPDNPRAVAESIKDMYEALKESTLMLKTLGHRNPDDDILWTIIKLGETALAKAEGNKNAEQD